MTDSTREKSAASQTGGRGPWVRRGIVLALVLAALVWLVVRPPAEQMIHLRGRTMGTTYSVRCVLDRAQAGDADFCRSLADAVAAALEEVNACMSTYRSDSELSRLNAHEGSEPVAVSERLLYVLERAVEVSRASDGAFDVTVGPVVNAYGFGPESRPVTLPSDEQIVQLRERVGYRLIDIDRAAGTVTKHHPEVFIDLGGIAKGYGADRVAEAIESKGVINYLVEVGGEVRVRGRRPTGALWRVGVEKPTDEGRRLHCVLELTDMAMATSGDYRNYYRNNGRRISHTIDPRTGRPVAHALASVTVLAADCLTADAWATALMVLGPEQGYNVAEREGLATLLLVRAGQDSFVEKRTPALDTLEASMLRAADATPCSAGSDEAVVPAR